MKKDNPFDKALETRRPPTHMRNALVDVADTLDFAWLIAKSVFEDKATPDLAVKLLPLILERADSELLARQVVAGG